MNVSIPEEKADKWFQSDVKLKIIQVICKATESKKFSISENRKDLNVHTGYIGDTTIEIVLEHPEYGEIRISGKNFI